MMAESIAREKRKAWRWIPHRGEVPTKTEREPSRFAAATTSTGERIFQSSPTGAAAAEEGPSALRVGLTCRQCPAGLCFRLRRQDAGGTFAPCSDHLPSS